MSSGGPPTIAELLNDPAVREALQDAWDDSDVNDPTKRHEEGGWIYMDTATGQVTTLRAPRGARASISLDNPPVIPGSVVVATFHTHPHPASEGWETGPSRGDIESAEALGVPCFIQAEDGIHTTGPDSRRGGLAGNPGFPD